MDKLMGELRTVRRPLLTIVDNPDGKPVQMEVNNGDLWILTDKGSIYVRLVGGQWQQLYIRKHKSINPKSK
jgi:hypothetical protein